MTDFYPLQARALSYTTGLGTTNNTWLTIAAATTANYDVIITSLKLMVAQQAFSDTDYVELAIEDGTTTDTKKIFRAEGVGEYWPSYQIFSKDSPCYLSQRHGNAEKIRIYKTVNCYWHVSFVNFASTQFNHSWGAMV